MLPKAMAATKPETTCANLKTAYKEGACCGSPSTEVPVQIVPNPKKRLTGTNPCRDKKKLTVPGMNNMECFHDGVRKAVEQSGADVTKGFKGGINTSIQPF